MLSHSMKIWERVIEARLRKEVMIREHQYGLMSRKYHDAIFVLRMLVEKYRNGQKELRAIFVDFEKAYDCVPRDYGTA